MKITTLWLMNEKGEVLTARRALHLDSDAGLWGPSLSGTIEDENEDIHENAYREALEELAFDLRPHGTKLIGQYSVMHNDGEPRDINMLYARVPSSVIEELQPHPEEVAEVKWIAIDDFHQLRQTSPHEIIVGHHDEMWSHMIDQLRAAHSDSE